MCPTDDLVDDLRKALRRAESFGDLSGIVAAQWAYGTVLLRANKESRIEAMEVLECAQTTIQRHRVMAITLAAMGADLAMDAARRGQRDESIDDLRASFSLHMGGGSRFFAGFPGEALVTLLIDRGSVDDLAEAHQIVDQWEVQRPGIPALDLWWLKSRALLADAEGNSGAYAKLANQYLALCERLDARGRLAEARRMVG
jgi:adenylate cyclase